MARVAGSIKSGEDRADEFFAGIKAREDEQYARAHMEEQQRKADEKQGREQHLLEAEEARRQEAFETEQAQKEQAMSQQGEAFDRKTKAADRSEAYEMVKQGIMMRDSKTVNAALQQLVPQGEDVITVSTTEGGARKFTGRPGQAQVPQFVFDPDSDYVGVIFPGQEKPTVFKSPKEAFQNVLAPMNPAHEQSKDQITAAKNRGELQFKDKKLTADIHDKAHEAAMKQFEFEGYYQPASYDPEKYENAYRQYVSRATGEAPERVPPPPEPSEEEKSARSAPKGAYTGDKAPKGYPGAKRAPNGAWYIKRGKGWAPILQGKGKAEKKKPAAKGRQMQNAGINVQASTKPDVVRKKMPEAKKSSKELNPTDYEIDNKKVFHKGSTLMVEDPPGKYRKLNDDERKRIGKIIRDTDVQNSEGPSMRLPKVGPLEFGKGIPRN
jgi:hypothetical protein